MAQSESGTRSITWVLSVLAVVAVVGLFYWLSVTAKPSTINTAPPSDTASTVTPGTPGVPTVTLANFATNIKSYVGQTIRIPGLKISSLLGKRAFWIQLPSSVPFLVAMDSSATVTGGSLASGAQLTVEGTVEAMSDSVLTAWQKQGVITASQKSEASFAQTFLEASQVVIQPAAADSTAAQPKTSSGA